MTEPNDDKYKKMAEKRNAGYEKKQAKATKEKGLVIINTGNGKGKSSAAFGMGIRAIGHGMKLGVVQFIKGAKETAERDVLNQFDNCEWHTIGDGFTWITQNRDQDIETCERAWTQAERMLKSSEYDMVILDELNAVLKYEYLDVERVLAALNAKPQMQHVIITGRHAHKDLVELADLVSEITPIKHPYKDQGIKAQKGIEF